MAFITQEVKKQSIKDTRGNTRRWYPYPKESPPPSGHTEVGRGFGFIVQDGSATYGHDISGIFYPSLHD